MIQFFKQFPQKHNGPAASGQVCRPSARRRRRTLAALARCRRSSVTLQLSIIAIPFFLLALGAMEVSYDLYIQAALNFAVSEATRQIWTGTAQGSLSSTSFVNSYVCPTLGGMVDCSLITMRVRPVRPFSSTDFWGFMNLYSLPNYQTGSGKSGTLSIGDGTWTVCTGDPGDAVLVEAVYTGPTFVGGFVPTFVVTYGGALVHPTYASSAFVNQTGFTSTAGC
jgi:hypothetical protein